MNKIEEAYNFLSTEQKNAFDLVMDFSLNSDMAAYVLSGVAGSGKSTLIKYVVDIYATIPNFKAAIVTYTGRAASTLQRKGVPAQTVHSAFYQPKFNEYKELIGFEFSSAAVAQYNVIIVDEASFIPKDMFENLMSVGVPILFVGDHEQLPPISKDDFNVMDHYDLCLTGIHRQAEGSPIIRLSRDIRETGTFNVNQYKSEINFIKRSALNVNYLSTNPQDIIIVGMNKTRKTMNQVARRAYGYDSEYPEIGERIMGLRNDGSVKNGEIYEVEFAYPQMYNIYRWGDHQDSFMVKVPDSCFEDEEFNVKPGDDMNWSNMTFAYASTCHKMQGSQFRKVMFIDEDVSFFVDRRKFRYTAVTRAQEELTIVLT